MLEVDPFVEADSLDRVELIMALERLSTLASLTMLQRR